MVLNLDKSDAIIICIHQLFVSYSSPGLEVGEKKYQYDPFSSRPPYLVFSFLFPPLPPSTFLSYPLSFPHVLSPL